MQFQGRVLSSVSSLQVGSTRGQRTRRIRPVSQTIENQRDEADVTTCTPVLAIENRCLDSGSDLDGAGALDFQVLVSQQSSHDSLPKGIGDIAIAQDAFWQYTTPYWARWFLRKWCTRAMRSRLEPFKKFVRTLRQHEELLMNYFKAGKLYSSGIVEGLNLKVKLGTRKAYGYRSFEIMKTALFHELGDLPQPKFTHRFC